jgi:hypothetical protein
VREELDWLERVFLFLWFGDHLYPICEQQVVEARDTLVNEGWKN